MNDSAPRRRRRRRGGGRKPAAEQSGAQPAPQAKGKSKDSGRRRSSQKQGAKPARKAVAVRTEKLSPEATLERMIRDFPPEYSKLSEFVQVCRKLRGRNEDHTDGEFFYFIATSIETLAEDKFDELFYAKYNADLKKIRTEAGLGEDEYWKPDDSQIPDAYRDLLDAFREEKRLILAKMLRSFGEADMADLAENDFAEYTRLRNEGKSEFYSRHRFEAVRMDPTEMDPRHWDESEEAEEDIAASADDDYDYDDDLGEEE